MAKKIIKLPKAKPAGLQHIELVLHALGVKFETEYRFLDGRMYRFDLAIPEKKIAIEYEGLQTPKTGKSRHTTNKGYSDDCIKYNHAILAGWKVLRFTAYNYKQAYDFLKVFYPDK